MLSIVGYQVSELLYEGNNSIVYRGQRQHDNLPVILKMLKQDYPSPEALNRYRQEYDITRSLENSGVIKVYNLQRHENTLVIILEDFGGEALKVAGKVSISTFLPLAIKLVDTLGEIHAADIIHKDINPSNIVWCPSSHQVKIIDFGISSRLPRENPILKNPEKLEGTLAYISPEQTGRMNRSLDYRTDLYSLGVTFYELLTGKLPFESDSALELVHCQIAKTPQPVHEIDPDIPPVISDVIQKLMAKNVEDRYQSAFGVKADLERCLDNLTSGLSDLQFELAQSDFSGKLHIPQKLYGREREVTTLLQAFERVSSGSTEMMLVAGYSGVGKTALVHEVHKPMTSKNGYFASGKFDQFQKNIPYSAITQAFNGFCRYLLMENESRLINWKTKILDALGNNAQIIIDVIPDLELIIGPQPKVIEVGPAEAQNRFQMFFLNFIKTLCGQHHPFTLFIDDLQWVDSASLSLLKSIMLDKDTRYFLIIGAYRDNEVSVSHPFMITVDELQQNHVNIHTIELDNLQLVHINQLLQDSLKCQAEQSQPLAQLIHQKTQGNAFFTHQFLTALYQENLLKFDFQQLEWQWDVDKISAKNMTDNVVELMASKIDKLPSRTAKVLKLAACIGNQFELLLLAMLDEQDHKGTLEALHISLTQGLIQPLDENYKQLELMEKARFKFLHDRVQQAAYALIDPEHKQAVHLRIGHLLLENVTDLEEHVFNIVDQFNESISIIHDKYERIRLAELNLKAGKRAKESIAYIASAEYLRTAISLLPENHWTSHYPLTFTLYLERAESEFFSSNFKTAETLSNELLKLAVSNEDKLKVYHLQIELYGTQAEYLRALEIGFEALKLFDINLPPLNEVQSDTFLPEMDKFKALLGDRSIDSLFDLPEMQDERAKQVLFLLSKLGDLALIGHPNSYQLLTFVGVNFSLQYGNSSHSAFAYVLLGVIFITQFRDHVTGHRLATMGIRLIEEKYPDPQLITKEAAFFAWHINHWMANPLTNLEVAKKGFLKAVECGNLAFASYCYSVPAQPMFFAGSTDLEEIIQESDKSIEFCDAKNLTFISALSRTMKMIVLNLQGKTRNSSSFSYQIGDEIIDEQAFINTWEVVPMVAGTYYIRKLQSLCLFGHYEKALFYVPLVEKHIAGCGGHITTSEYHFYCALSIYSLYLQQPLAAEEQRYATNLEISRAFIKKCADQCESNFFVFHCLLEAEEAHYEGNDLQAMSLYDEAIAAAKEKGFIQNEGLANELAAKFYLEKGREKVALVYFNEARYAYQQWGAVEKVKSLEERYPQWLTRKSTATETTTTLVNTLTATVWVDTQTAPSQWLDLESVMKAAQILSSEIVLSWFLKKMMNIVIENAGAERGFLLLPQEDNWVIEAEGAIDKEEVTTLQSLPIEDSLPDVIINYVAHTKDNVVLTNAFREGLYTNNAYIQANQTQSVLCFPIVYQKQLQAILYFENNLTTGAFTQQRLNVLTMLSSQIAISLENARFVEKLETARRQAEVANETKTAFLANVSHELRTPLNAILGYIQLFNGKANLSTTLREGSQLIEQNSKYLLTLINDIIDISIVDRGKIAIFPIDIRFDTFLNNLVSVFLHRAKEKGLSFHYTLSPELPLGISSDEKRLRQILTHLLSNAIKFTQTGKVTFTVTRHEDNIRFLVEDTGVGIAQEHLDTVFLPFEQVSKWQHKSEGAGLGLSLVKKLVNALDGVIHVRSEINQGSCFQVDLPLIESNEWIGDITFSEQQTMTEPEFTEETLDDLLQEAIQLLSAEQMAALYDSSMTGDIHALIEQADSLEQLTPKFAPLVEKIRQATQVFDSDPIADLLTPFLLDA